MEQKHLIRATRRSFIALLVGAAATLSTPSVQAQSTDKRPLIAFLGSGREETSAPSTAAFLDGMHALGYVEGRTIDIAIRFADFNAGRLPLLAQDLVRLHPDVIVTTNPPAAVAAEQATQSMPIVTALLDDPVRLGLVQGYARTGSNLTGILNAVEGLPTKQVEIALELLPGATMLGLLLNPDSPANPQRKEIEATAARKGIKIVVAEARAKTDLEAAFKTLGDARAQIVIVVRNGMLLAERVTVAQLAEAAHLPTVYSYREQVEAGGLVSYGVDVRANYRRVAYFVDKILKGAKPSDLPIEFPTTLEMAINLKTAKALRMTIPRSLLLRADEVIE